MEGKSFSNQESYGKTKSEIELNSSNTTKKSPPMKSNPEKSKLLMGMGHNCSNTKINNNEGNTSENTKYTLKDLEEIIGGNIGAEDMKTIDSMKKNEADELGCNTAEQMLPAARIIYVFEQIKKKFTLDSSLINEINWCIEQIAMGSIYQPVLSGDGIAVSTMNRSQILPWIAQFSTPTLDMDTIQSLLKKNAKTVMNMTQEEIQIQRKERAKRRSVVTRSIASEVLRVKDFLCTINTPTFSIIESENRLGRTKVLPLVAYKVFEENDIFTKTQIDENAFVAFISEIRKGYMDNPYHNEVHAADVLQMCHYIVNQGGAREILKLTDLDIAALFLSAIVHDFRHPGVTNGFLINSNNDLALAYNDKSVLESYHISETFKLITKNEDCNIFKNLTLNEKILIRKRMIGCVLATDMSLHRNMLEHLKSLIICHKIKKGKNNTKVINPKQEFDSKQFMLEVCLHASDCGNPCRNFEVGKELALRLTEEFGRQGDVEKSLNLPVTFLCDRSTVNLPVSQVGFIAGITRPMAQMLVNIFPKTQPLLDNALKNENIWKNYKAK